MPVLVSIFAHRWIQRRIFFVLLVAAGVARSFADDGTSSAPEVDADAGPIAAWQFTREGQAEDRQFRPQFGALSADMKGELRFADQAPHALLLDGDPAAERRLRVTDTLAEAQLPAGALSVEAWVKIDKPIEWGGIVGAFQDNGNTEQGWLLGYTETNFYFAVASQRRRKLSYLGADRMYQPGYWYHVVGTYDGVSQKIYVDGKLRKQSTHQQGAITYPQQGFFTVGAYHDSNEFRGLAGELEGVAIWDRALTAAEVAARFEQHKRRFPEVDPVPFHATDWPTYGRDNGRTARSDTDLQVPLKLAWRMKLRHPPQPAWPAPARQDFWNKRNHLPARVTFDRYFQLVSVGDCVYLGSSADDQLFCLDADSGAIRWRYFAEAPIRLAPTVDKGRVLFGSDDGYVYCLDAADGRLFWKYRDPESHQWIPGNERMINTRPVRSGVLVSGDVGYYCAGLLPSQGVRQVAIDLRTGRPISAQPIDASAQGYLQRRAGRMFTPTGRDRAGAFLAMLDRRGKDPEPEVLQLPEQVSLAAIGAGQLQFGGGDGSVAALDAEGNVIWQADVEGRAGSLCAARGRLLVSTDKGYVYCFTADAEQPRISEQVTRAQNPYPEARQRQYADLADEIVRRSAADQGYCLLLDCGEGQLAYELAKRTRLKIVALERDLETAHVARERLSAAGLYGRVVVHTPPSQGPLRYVDYVFNLIVRDKLAGGEQVDLAPGEARRLLRPYGGVAMFVAGAEDFERRGPLADVGEWTHMYADAANTACSLDRHVSGPFALQWFGRPGPQGMIDRHHRTVPPLFKSGILYVPGNERVFGVDAYNGTPLWEVAVPGSRRIGVMRDCGSMAATDEGVLVATGSECWLLDASHGGQRAKFAVPATEDGKPRQWGYVACIDKLLIGSAVRPAATRRGHNRAAIEEGTYFDLRPVVSSDALFAMERSSGALQWRYDPEDGVILNPTIAIGDGRIYFIQTGDAQTGVSDDGRVRLDRALAKRARLVALDAGSGETVWQIEVDYKAMQHHLFGTFAAGLLVHVGSHNGQAGLKESNVWYDVVAYDAATGEPAWSRSQNNRTKAGGDHGEQDHHPVVVGDRLYVEPYAYELPSGLPIDDWGWNRGHRRGCGTLSASACALFFRDTNPTTFDLQARQHAKVTKVSRPGCWINMIPAGGLLLIPEASSGCSCEFAVQTSMALRPLGRPAAEK